MSTPVTNLVIEKGTDFEAAFILSGEDGELLNLSYSSIYANIKKHPTSKISHEFNVGISTEDSEVTISMGRTQTSELFSGRNYFGVYLNNTELNFMTRVVTGTIIVEDTTL